MAIYLNTFKKKTFPGLVRCVGGLITVGGISDLKRLLDWVRGSKGCDFSVINQFHCETAGLCDWVFYMI